jgi:TIR domain-containing protein
VLNFVFVAEETPIHDNTAPTGNIFVAYAREDERAVERLRTGLNRYVNVTWHSHLKFPELATERPQGVADTVRDCDIFLSVFSRATAARGDDYSWLELIWVEMWKKISTEGKHYVAVLIDDLPEPPRREAHSFPDVKYIRLPEGEVSPEFGAQIRGLLEESRAAEEDNYETRMAPPPAPQMIAGAAAVRRPSEFICAGAPQEQPGLLERLSDVIPSEKVQPEKPLVHDENVQFTVYRPKVIVPQKWHTMLAFAHLSEKAADASPDDPDPVAEVARQARQILGQDDDYGQTTQDSTQAIPREGEITMVPMVEGITFNPARHTFLWTEPVHREEFRLRAASPALEPKTVLRGRLTIYLGGLILAEIPLKFQAELAASPAPAQNMSTTQARPYRKIFASYSHRDAPIVEHIEHYANAVGDSYLRDAVNLRSGQDWNDELMRMIDQADIFQLFWSSNSMHSKYCRQEWEYALGLNRPSFIRPTYWEEPFPQVPHESLPPDALRSLHFQRIMSSRLPKPQPERAARVASPFDEPPSLLQERADSFVRKSGVPLVPPAGRAETPAPGGVGSSSLSAEERILLAGAAARPSPPEPMARSSGGMAPASSASAPRRSSGGRRAGKIALVACVAVVAIGGFSFQFGRQNTMTASAPAAQDAEKQLEQQAQNGQMPIPQPAEQTASAQMAPTASDVAGQTATAQAATDTNAPAAATFDSSPSPQTQTADTAAAAAQQDQPPAAAAMPASPPVIAPTEPAEPTAAPAAPPAPPPQQ